MKKTTLLLCMILALTGLSTSALATPFTVLGTASIFNAGGATSADGGSTAPGFTLGSGGGSISFSGVTGNVTCGTVPGFCNGAGAPAPTSNGPDGASYTGMSLGATNITSPGSGISGYSFNGREMSLVGVFLDNNTPSGTPANFAAYSPLFADNSTVFSPGIGQVFYVGNGLTGGPSDPPGVTQTFVVPGTATRLFLGFAEASGFVGFPAGYSDNQGSVSGNFTFTPSVAAIPEPGTMLLMGLGLLGLSVLRKRVA